MVDQHLELAVIVAAVEEGSFGAAGGRALAEKADVLAQHMHNAINNVGKLVRVKTTRVDSAHIAPVLDAVRGRRCALGTGVCVTDVFKKVGALLHGISEALRDVAARPRRLAARAALAGRRDHLCAAAVSVVRAAA